MMCEPQMERMSPRMSLLSRGTDQTGPGKRMWILAPASPLLLHFKRCLGSALPGLQPLLGLLCSRFKRSRELTLETSHGGLPPAPTIKTIAGIF